MVNDQETNVLVFFVNGKKVIDLNPDPECTLLTYLRQNLRLCGTKLGCAEGGCGACTVMISKYDRINGKVKHFAANACLTPVCAMHGLSVTTIEGIGSTRTKLHPVQERIAKAHGSQCGFCTPGIVMSMYALLRNSPIPNMKDLEVAFQGNLCRCTGYRPIIEGYRTFTEEYKTCAMGDKCCKVSGNKCGPNIDDKLFEPSDFTPYDPSQEPIFPPELKLNDEYDKQYLVFRGDNQTTWFRPTSLEKLLEIKKLHTNAKIVVGNTEIGVEVKFKHFEYPILINSSIVEELYSVNVLEDGIKIGAAVSLTDLQMKLEEQIKVLPKSETKVYNEIVKMLHYFAGRQIRNVASLAGNIMTGSPISDLNPILMAAKVELEVQSIERGLRKIRMDEKFFTGYRKNVVAPDEILLSVIIPKTKSNQQFIAFKQAKRRDDDIAIVTGAFSVWFKKESDVIEEIDLAFGGMAPTTVLALKTADVVRGKKWNSDLVEIVNKNLLEELTLSASAPGGMISYRRSLTMSLFFKAYLAISQTLENELNLSLVTEREKSGALTFHTLTPKSTQLFEKVASDQCKTDPVGRPKIHSSAFKQVTGEAVYCDDLPRFENELYLGLVLSTKAHAKLVSINADEALKLPGVHAFYSAKDITPHENQVGPVIHDEEVFIRETVTSQGQVLGAIVADTQKLAQKAARMVKVVYEDLSPVIVTIEDAIKHKSFFPGYPKVLVKGDPDKVMKESDFVFEGEFRMGGQEHFYLETHAALAYPKDFDEIEVFSSTQHTSEVQKLTAHALGIPAHRVVCKTKRLGGGFGGKESRGCLIAIPTAFAAYKLRRPVRIMLDRDEDMMITGTRHPFYFKYKVSCTKDGVITACEAEVYNNAGYSMDLSFSVLDRAMFHFQNTYRIPDVRISGTVLKTHLPSNTAFRGFGGPQGMMLGEHIVRHVAQVTGLDYIDVQRLNLYKEGDITHYNQKLINCTIERCFKEVLESSSYEKRKQDVAVFNSQNRWRKRGINLVNTMFGISFTAPHLNQAGALVCVYVDGSVLVTHGGVEMGQGLHTKMIQVAAKTLQIPIEKIHISETSTDKVPNTSPTAASAGSDLNGMAVLNACKIIYDRLAPYREKCLEEGWDKWVYKAYYDRVCLSATGFYVTPELGYNFNTNSGLAFNYYTFGSAVSEVEIDCLSGDHQVIRTDIVMDLGSSLNPAIDIGQIEGAFMQGYGLFTLEELVYSPTGTLYSRGPGMYKIPGFADIPGEFNVSLLTGAPNPRAVYSSKAVGEPPLFLASSVFFAIKEAISAARKEENLDPHFYMQSPATAARIRMACHDSFTKKIEEPAPETFTPWNVMP